MYAYLPVRSYGLPFALQADWLVPASRQDVSNNAWNQALREAVPMAFLAAVARAQASLELRLCWYRYVPQASRVNGFFKPVSAGASPFTVLLYYRRSKLLSAGLMLHCCRTKCSMPAR